MPELTTPAVPPLTVPSSKLPPSTTPHAPQGHNVFASCLSSAMYWSGYGLKVIPIGPGSKIPALKWDPWLEGLDDEKVYRYWKENPDHELGFIVGDDMIVFDADGPESVNAIKEIESRFAMTPQLIVSTTKGEHHYYRRGPHTIAKSDAHSSEKYPDRLDIKTGRALVILPPSTGKKILVCKAENKDELTEAPQEFIDAINLHNGRSVQPHTSVATPRPFTRHEGEDVQLDKVVDLLRHIDPDSGYQDWLRVGLAIFHESQGNDDGLALFDSWSSKGKKYKGTKDIETKWRSFQTGVASPVTLGTLVKMARDNGADVGAIISSGDDAFEVCESEVIRQGLDSQEKRIKYPNPLDKYSLLGMSDDIEKCVGEQVPVLGDLAVTGQSTVIYAAPNTGKTLICLHLLMESLKATIVNPKNVYYINVDDSANGLLEKLRIAEEYGFHMLAEGYRDFKAKEFMTEVQGLVESNKASGVVIFLDTLKKFTNLMDKAASSRFTRIIRDFVMKGGTVIALAHTNKNPGRDGKRVHAGTSDIMDDFDCAYILETISENKATGEKVVEFTNKKMRGNVALSASYSYAHETGITYNELLLSVKEVDETQLGNIKYEVETKSDAEVIAAIESCINEGINSKMRLADAAAERIRSSKRHILEIVEKYSGDDIAIHKWCFSVRERGAKVYTLLVPPAEQPPTPAITSP